MSCISVKGKRVGGKLKSATALIKAPVKVSASVVCHIGDGLWAFLRSSDGMLKASDGFLMVKNKGYGAGK